MTTSPDVTVSTNLGAWVNQRGLFNRHEHPDVFREENVASIQKWVRSQSGQHFELGIAENNLFLMLAALGLSEPLFGARLLPVGTLYDPFVNRGLDALNYACYQDARFMVAGTPAGVTLAPEGGAHQSVNTPLVGMSMPGLAYFEPAYADELATIMGWGFDHMQADDGGSVYLRLSTRNIAQPERTLTAADRTAITTGAYWLAPPAQAADLAIVYAGAVAPEAVAAHAALLDDIPGAGLLAVTSPDRLHGDWLDAKRRRRAGDRARAGADRNNARPVGGGRGADHGDRRPPDDAVLARRGGHAEGDGARRRPVRTVWRSRRSLPRGGHRRRLDPRRRRLGLPHAY